MFNHLSSVTLNQSRCTKMNRKIFIERVKDELNLGDLNWETRHFLPSSKSGYIIREHMGKRKSLIRDMSTMISIKTNLPFRCSMVVPWSQKRFFDAIFDWECIGILDKRNEYLKKVAEIESRENVVSFLDRHFDNIVLIPEDADGYDQLSETDRTFLDGISIYSGVPEPSEITRDLSLVTNIGENRAKKLLDNGIVLYETLTKHTNYSMFLFRPNKNHVASFKVMFDVAYKTVTQQGGDQLRHEMIIAGSFGRGDMHGHDIDLLFHEGDNVDVLATLNALSHKVISVGKSYNVIIMDTFVRIDVNFYTDKNKLTNMMHYFGPKDMNIMIRAHAKKRGYLVNQYGIINIATSRTLHPTSSREFFDLISMKSDPRDRYWKNKK